MPLHASWADHLFAKLSVRYGAAFMRQWPDADPVLVKADWCDVLDGFERHPEAFTYALANLPDKPLNAIQFRALARCAPTPAVPALPEPAADPDRVQAAVDRMTTTKATLQAKSFAQQCIDNIERIVANRAGAISSAQKAMVASCLRVPGTTTTLPVPRVDLQPEGADA
jgi:hypothetical protein